MTELFSLNLVDPWRAKAACRGMDVNLFHPDRGVNSVDAQKAICATCPVKAECLKYALDMRITVGIYGGTTETERRRLRSGHVAEVVSRHCDHCHEVFEAVVKIRGHERIYCSRRCSQRASYERRRLSA